MPRSTMSSSRRKRLQALREPLDALYARYNQRAYVHPDPLAPLYGFTTGSEREVAGLITATLAFGNVKQILRSIDGVFQVLPEVTTALPTLSDRQLQERLAGFRHRYVTGAEMASLLAGIRAALRDYGSVGACFDAFDDAKEPTLVPALTRFVTYLKAHGTVEKNYLLPAPEKGSACKRWFMYLRWMVRDDEVDLGHWAHLGAHRLVVPVDTHMHRIARGLFLTRRKSGDLRTALEITQAFAAICPEDPIRYDFCLTRLGIRDDGDMARFLREARDAARAVQVEEDRRQ